MALKTVSYPSMPAPVYVVLKRPPPSHKTHAAGCERTSALIRVAIIAAAIATIAPHRV
jgi:hypothetical protein